MKNQFVVYSSMECCSRMINYDASPPTSLDSEGMLLDNCSNDILICSDCRPLQWCLTSRIENAWLLDTLNSFCLYLNMMLCQQRERTWHLLGPCSMSVMVSELNVFTVAMEFPRAVQSVVEDSLVATCSGEACAVYAQRFSPLLRWVEVLASLLLEGRNACVAVVQHRQGGG